MRRLVALMSLLFLVPGMAAAEDDQEVVSNKDSEEIVVTASRIPVPLDKTGSSISVYTSQQMEQAQETSVQEALQHIPGVDVVRSGPQGGNTVAFIRGANSEHTLILLDGIELNNPGSPNRAFNLADLTLEDVERIEVLRGPQSTLYGSDAMGGVINIITKKGKKGVSVHAAAEAGSYNTYREQGGFSYGNEIGNASFGVIREDTNGISAADARDGNTEHDGYGKTSLTGNIGVTPIEELEGNFIIRYNESNSDIDNSGGAFGDDPNRKVDNEETFLRGEAKTHFANNTLSQIFGISFSDHSLTDNNDPDAGHLTDILRSNFDGDILKFDFQNRWDICDYASFIAGAETENEHASSKYFSDGAFGPFQDDFSPKSVRTNGYYGDLRISPIKNAVIEGGLRVDDNSKFGNHTTFRIAPALTVESSGTILRGSVGTGYKAPSLFQLYSSYGDPNLDPEKSVGWDVGVEQTVVENMAKIGLTFFHNHFDDLLTFDSNTFKLRNINEASSAGIEISSTITPWDWLQLTPNYTYTDTEDESTGGSLLRRPRNKFGVDINAKPVEKLNLHLFVNSHGKAFDTDFSGAEARTVSLSGYATVDIAASYEITRNVELTARIDNLFDQEYQEVLGYGTYGTAAFGGIKVKM